MKKIFMLGFLLVLLQGHAYAQNAVDDQVSYLRYEWEHANYELDGPDKAAAFEALEQSSSEARQKFPDSAEVLIWDGIIKSTYAGIKGGLGALKLAKQAKSSFESAIAINGEALNGSAYTSLGILYARVPGWPVAFGSNKKAAELLLKGLTINPEGIDSNFFYAEFLAENGQKAKAREYYLRAKRARPRQNRAIADAGRLREVETALEKI